MFPAHLWDGEPCQQNAGWRGEGWRRHWRPLRSWEKVKGGTCYSFIIFIIISSTSHSPVWEKNTRKPNLHTPEDAKKLTTIPKIHLTNKHPVTELHVTTGGYQREPSSLSPVWLQLWSLWTLWLSAPPSLYLHLILLFWRGLSLITWSFSVAFYMSVCVCDIKDRNETKVLINKVCWCFCGAGWSHTEHVQNAYL